MTDSHFGVSKAPPFYNIAAWAQDMEETRGTDSIYKAYCSGLNFGEYPNNSYGQPYGTNVPPCIGSWNSHWCINLACFSLEENDNVKGKSW